MAFCINFKEIYLRYLIGLTKVIAGLNLCLFMLSSGLLDIDDAVSCIARNGKKCSRTFMATKRQVVDI